MPFTRLDNFQLGFGLLHAQMNLYWSILNIHRGKLSGVGSLSWFFAVLDRTRLGGEHPNFYTLQSAFKHIVDGLILNAWERECGAGNLDVFARSKPSPEKLMRIAEKILVNYASPSSEGIDEDSPDPLNKNIQFLLRDLLYARALDSAVGDGDFGRIEDMLGLLAMMFRGAGSYNYSTEILHWLHNTHTVWPEKFANIMRDNMLINPSGRAGHSMGRDLQIEHLIRDIKGTATRKGVYGSWEYYGDISVSIPTAKKLKDNFTSQLGSMHRGNHHSETESDIAVARILAKAKEHHLLNAVHDDDSRRVTPVVDILTAGDKKLRTSITAFNKKMKDMVAGRETLDEHDELAPCELQAVDTADDTVVEPIVAE